MTIQNLWDVDWTNAIVSHLWQSTAIVAVAWLLTIALRNYPARIRFSIWMLASIKFLVPFALLTRLGSHWAKPRPQAHVAFYTIIEDFGQPFAQKHAIAAPTPIEVHSFFSLPFAIEALTGIWLCGFLFMLVRWIIQWRKTLDVIEEADSVVEGREVVALRCAEAAASFRTPIRLVVTPKAVEPGIFGIFQPVLMWPSGLSNELDDAQVAAIMAHELEHVRRRDNFSSAVQSAVEAIFWFHPALRWIGLKMQDERERACDETVIEMSIHPTKYAESILTVCAFCLESPLPCVSGVSGSDLKKRVLRIMTHRKGVALTASRRALLAMTAMMVLAVPIGFGALHGQSGPDSKAGLSDSGPAKDLPKYDVASVKPASTSDGMRTLMMTPDGMSIKGIPVQMLLRAGFGVEDDRIIGAPSWVKSNRFDIEAKVTPDEAPKLDKLKQEARLGMLIPLLEERFNLKYHHETRELPMYALVVAKGGPKLSESKAEPAPGPDDPPRMGPRPNGAIDTRGRMMMMPGKLESQDTTISMLSHALGSALSRSVVDKTGLTGRYDYTLKWTPDNAPPPMPGADAGATHEGSDIDPTEPSIFAAIQEQLGLKLESEKGNVDVIVIDHIDLPSEN